MILKYFSALILSLANRTKTLFAKTDFFFKKALFSAFRATRRAFKMTQRDQRFAFEGLESSTFYFNAGIIHRVLIRLTNKPCFIILARFHEEQNAALNSIMSVVDVAQVLDFFIFWQNVVRVVG